MNWGAQMEFCGRVMETDVIGEEFSMLDVSLKKFPCFSILHTPEHTQLTSGMIVRGIGDLKQKKFNFADEKEAVSLPYVDVKEMLEFN